MEDKCPSQQEVGDTAMFFSIIQLLLLRLKGESTNKQEIFLALELYYLLEADKQRA